MLPQPSADCACALRRSSAAPFACAHAHSPVSLTKHVRWMHSCCCCRYLSADEIILSVPADDDNIEVNKGKGKGEPQPKKRGLVSSPALCHGPCFLVADLRERALVCGMQPGARPARVNAKYPKAENMR